MSGKAGVPSLSDFLGVRSAIGVPTGDTAHRAYPDWLILWVMEWEWGMDDADTKDAAEAARMEKWRKSLVAVRKAYDRYMDAIAAHNSVEMDKALRALDRAKVKVWRAKWEEGA